jgi:hypothetical protein
LAPEDQKISFARKASVQGGRVKFGDFTVLYDISDAYRPTADFAIFNVGLLAHGEIKHHGDLLPAVRAQEPVFHKREEYSRGARSVTSRLACRPAASKRVNS